MPANGLAALTNHSISLSCSSRDRVDGWNSLSTHRSAAAMSAHDDPGANSAIAATVPITSFLIWSRLLPCLKAGAWPAPSLRKPLDPPEHRDGVDEREAESPPQVRADQPEPCEMNEGAAQERNEKPVAARGLDPEHAAARRAPRRGEFPHGHGDQQQGDHAEEDPGLPG